MKQYQYATLKKVAAEADDIDATLKLLSEAGVVSTADARAIKAEAESEEALNVLPTFDEIIAALEDEGCHNVAKELHTILTSVEDDAAVDDGAEDEEDAGEEA